jgi:terminase large subunit-like protein
MCRLRLRARALAGAVERKGAVTDARAPGLRMLEWSVADDVALNLRSVKAANPAPWITAAGLREQRERVTPLAFAQFHACRWGVGEASWLPVGAWGRCAASYGVEDGERVWLGVDVGGSRAASAVVGVTEDLRVACVHVFEGQDSVLEVTACLEDLAERFVVAEVAYDPWRFQGEALRLDGRLTMVEFPQSAARMVPASERLHAAVVERRLRHPNDPDLNRHVAGAVAKATGRGWRLDKSERSAQIDAVVAMAMAVERAEHKVPQVELVGWL